MKNEDKILLFLDGQMNEEDRRLFLKEIESDSVLKAELARYREFMEDINSLKNIKTDPDYFINIIPEFRKNIGVRKKYRIIPKLALGLTTISAVVLLLIFTFRQPGVKKVNTAAGNNIDSIFDSYTYNFSPLQNQIDFNNLTKNDYSNIDSLVTDMLSNELDLSSQNLADLTNSNGTTDLQSMLQGINSEEANNIYNELLHKRIY